ncbi:uncharacterized protein Tco025E_02268 [Trypanosoma conorhini]|uniref:Uncharacterized protein n=1 Tax=Trypanosoma conorhini TaxID=83891 RepID=A0A422Q5Z0_9TRYP|nr:uncharacterized protein Tco025E_02268 [Trypanosoma conorhini]RNF25364.1 hypothetical protein Tco025E_02268 [Trypanosoma conorhini]
MEKVSILHAFPNGSTFLADAPSSILRHAVGAAGQHGSSDAAWDKVHEAFMNALSASMTSAPSWAHDDGERKELTVMRVVPITGSASFHRRLLADCEAYCRLCRRLQHAVDWLLLRPPTQKNRNSSTVAPSHASDVDCLSHVVYPTDPAAFLTAAFALPLLVAVTSSLPDDEEHAANGGQDGSHSSESSRTVPYCFFYKCPGQRLWQSDAAGTHSRGSYGDECASEGPRLTLMERVTAVANVAGVCGCVSPLHSALSVRNRAKIGLTLAAYLEGCLPLSVTTSDGGAPETVATAGEDPFSRWQDDILWRLLGLLVSALAVVHASGFHFCGELSADDVLCFALPDDDDDDGGGSSAVAQYAPWPEKNRGPKSIGQRLNAWVKGNQRGWLITDATPAHHAFFMFTILPRSLFMEEAKAPADVAAAAAQRRDTAAVGRILLTAVEEMKRRRGAKGLNSCSELLFVAERMAAVEGGGGRMLESEAPARRFSQLQAVQLRTYLWLLRAIVEERDAQLAAALLQNSSAAKSKEPEIISAAPPPSEDSRAFLEELRERDRLLSERERKLDRFLHLYELTAERLDELPVKQDSFEYLRRSLLRTPRSQPTPTPRAAPRTPSAAAPIGPAKVRQPTARPTRRPATAESSETTPSDRVRPLYGLLRSSRDDTAGAASASTPTTATSSRSVAVPPGRERRTYDVTPRQAGLRASSESASRRHVVATGSSSLLHLNWKTVGSMLFREGVTAAAATARSPRAYRPKSVLPGNGGRAFTARPEASSALATAAASAAAAGKAPAAPSPARREPSPAAAASSEERARHLTPSRGQARVSVLLSPDVSPLARVADDNSSFLLATGYKTPPRTTSITTPPRSRGDAASNVWNRLSTPHSTSGTTQAATPRHTHEKASLRYEREPKMSPASELALSPVSEHLSGTTPRNKASGYSPSLYVAPPKAATNLFATPPSATKRGKTPGFGAQSPPIKGDSSVQVIQMHDDSGDSFCLDASREAPLGRQRGDGVSGSNSGKTRTPVARSLDTTQRLASSGDTPASKYLNGSDNFAGGRQPGTSQQSTPRRPQSRLRKEREETATPRTSRPRLANDGWVDHKLEALEQLRYDFQQSEHAKGARSPPRGEAFARSAREPNAASGWGASTLPADGGKNGGTSAWGSRSGQPAAQAASNGAKRMY